MAILQIQPAQLALTITRGDECHFSATFDVDLTGYAFYSAVWDVRSGPETAIFSPSVGMQTVVENGVTKSVVTFVISESQTEQLDINKQHRWFFRWVSPAGVTRAVLSGAVSARNP